MYKDEEGKEIISLGLFIGLVISSFIIGFSASVISQDRTYGTDKINYFQAFIDGVFASALTALSYIGLSALSVAFASTSLGSVQYCIDTMIHNTEIDWKGFASNAIFSFFAGLFGSFNNKSLGLTFKMMNAGLYRTISTFLIDTILVSSTTEILIDLLEEFADQIIQQFLRKENKNSA